MATSPLAPYRHYVAVFIDVMGQKELLRDTPHPLEPGCLDRQETQDAYDRTVGIVTNIAATLEKGFQHYSKKYTIQRQFFSDCMLFYFPLENVTNHFLQEKELYNLQAFFTSAALCQILYLSYGTPLRGGIDLGLGSVNEPVGLYGAINHSLERLEKKVANYPRIVVGDSLKKYIDLQKPDHTFWLNRLLLYRDGAWMIDFLGNTVSEIISGKKGPVPEMSPDVRVGRAYHFVRNRREHFRKMIETDCVHKKTNEKLYHKYELLYEYVREQKDKYWGKRKRVKSGNRK